MKEKAKGFAKGAMMGIAAGAVMTAAGQTPCFFISF